MIPMFPFSINNTLKLFTMDNIDEEAIKERISQAVIQSLPNKRNIKFNAIVVLECDNDQRRTIVINETFNNNNNVPNGNNGNNQKLQLTATFPGNSFTAISTSDSTTPTSVALVSQQPFFPATLEGLQALLNLNRANMSFIPMQTENNNNNNNDSSVKKEKNTDNNDSGLPSRKRKSEKPCRIPQDSVVTDTNGLDLTLGGRYEEKCFQTNSVPIWPCPPSLQNNVARVKKPAPLPGHKKSSKVFNCNQCKLQFNSLNALCKHTFSDHRAFRCTFCSANFTQRSNLQRHSLKHVGFKPFICNVCSKAYYRKDHLVRHIEVSHPGSDPKSNITVKLSSSECLEYLEKMQNNKMLEMSILEGEGNHFLKLDNLPNSNLIDMSVIEEHDNHFLKVEKSSACSGDVIVPEDSPGTLPPFGETRDTSPADEDSESPEKLHVSLEDSLIKEEYEVSSNTPEYPGIMNEETFHDYPCTIPEEPLHEYHCVSNLQSFGENI